jgi:hypothetical protein
MRSRVVKVNFAELKHLFLDLYQYVITEIYICSIVAHSFAHLNANVENVGSEADKDDWREEPHEFVEEIEKNCEILCQSFPLFRVFKEKGNIETYVRR